MKNQTASLAPGWAERHIPAPGSVRPYMPLGYAEMLEPRAMTNPIIEAVRRNNDSAAEFNKLERLAR